MGQSDGPQRGLHALDMDAVEEAISLLREEEFAVEGVADAYHEGAGVWFTLELYKMTRTATYEGDEDEDSLPAVMVALDEDGDPEALADELRERDGVLAVKWDSSGLSREEVEEVVEK